MERNKRSDSPIWRNPCGYPYDIDTLAGNKEEIDPIVADKVQKAAHNALEGAKDYKDLFTQAKLTMKYDEAIMKNAERHSYLVHPWYDVPKKASEEWDFNGIHKKHFEDNLGNMAPMYKYLELLLGALDKIPSDSQISNSDDSDLQENLYNTVYKLRNLLCEVDALLFNRYMKKLPSLEPSEVPNRARSDTQGGLDDFLVFRDILNFLEFMDAFFRFVVSTGQ